MYIPTELKSYMRGVDGSFLMVNDTTTFSDIDFDVDELSTAIYYLRECIRDNCEASKLYVYAQKKNMVFYLDKEFTMGVMVSKNANIHLLHRVVKKIFSYLSSPAEEASSEEETVRKVREFFITG